MQATAHFYTTHLTMLVADIFLYFPSLSNKISAPTQQKFLKLLMSVYTPKLNIALIHLFPLDMFFCSKRQQQALSGNYT